MYKMRWKLMLAGVFLVGAFGTVALKVAWATPPKGVTNIAIAGPVELDEIHIVQQDRDYGAMIKTRGLSDAYVRHLTIAPGGDTGWHSHPGPVFVLVTAGTGSFYFAADPTFTPVVYPAGTGFVEGGGDVHMFRNEGNVDLEATVLFSCPTRRADADRRAGSPGRPVLSGRAGTGLRRIPVYDRSRHAVLREGA